MNSLITHLFHDGILIDDSNPSSMLYAVLHSTSCVMIVVGVVLALRLCTRLY